MKGVCKMKKAWLSLFLTAVLLLITSIPVLASLDWENCVWLSMDQNQEIKRMGYFHQEDVVTRIVSEFETAGSASFDLTLGNTLVSFDRSSGLYGQIGVNSRKNLNILFGGGFIYQNERADLLLTVGTRVYMQDKILVNELQVFYRFLPPFLVNLGYDDYTKSLFIGLGLAFN